MSGLLSRCPPLRAQAAHGANQGCLRACCVRCLRARVGRLRFVRAGRLLFHGSPLALTLGCAHTLLCGRSCVRAGGGRAGLLWACLLAGGWVGCLRLGCVRLGCLRACLCARLGVVGRFCVPPPRLFSLAALGWVGFWCSHFGVWALGRARWLVRGGLGGKVGRDMIVPPHVAWRAPFCCVAWGRVVNIRAHTEREGGGATGRAIVAWLGAGVVCAFWCVQSSLPAATGVGNARERGMGWLPSGLCGLGGGGGCVPGGGASPLGCVGGAGGVALSSWWWGWGGGNDFPR